MKQFKLIATLIFFISTPLGGCQFISGIDGSSAQGGTTSLSFDEIVTSVSPTDGSIIPLDGYLIITFDSNIELNIDAAKYITFNPATSASTVTDTDFLPQTSNSEVNFNAEVNYNRSLEGYQITIQTTDLISPGSEYSVCMLSDFTIIYENVSYTLGADHCFSYTTPTTGGSTDENRIYYSIQPTDNGYIIGGCESTPPDLTPGLFVYGLQDGVWGVTSTTIPDDPADGTIEAIAKNGDDYYAFATDSVPANNVYIHKFNIAGGQAVIQNSQTINLPNAYLLGPSPIRIINEQIIVPLSIATSNDFDDTQAYILTCDLSLTQCNLDGIWEDMLPSVDSIGVLDVAYFNDSYVLAGYTFKDIGYTANTTYLQISDSLHPTVFESEDLISYIRGTGFIAWLSMTTLSERLFAAGLMYNYSIVASSFSFDSSINWDETLAGSVYDLERPARRPIVTNTNGSDKLYISYAVSTNLFLDVRNIDDGSIINKYTAPSGGQIGGIVDFTYSNSSIVLVGYSMVEGPPTEISGIVRILDERGNYNE